MRLVCFPHAGGSASFFYSWSDSLPTDVELLSVQYPGRQERLTEPCVENMDELVAGITHSLSRFLDHPFVLFGHSMGASVAFEVSRQLERAFGVSPRMLYVSGQEAPHTPMRREPVSDDDEALLSEIRRINGGNAETLDDPDLRDLALPAIRADFRLLEAYRPQPVRSISAPITSYVGDQDADVDFDSARAWAQATRGTFRFQTFPGGHFYLSDCQPGFVSDLVRAADH
ncbi:thioesterase II family protein [Streptomyces milbemycinicus]|uniref:thioesterase II family protein n=1 Tax=Streptomyces milbemycinicus TaxID=476552 RepID=UPI000A37B77A|nr:alpha/beta fold hydrolase [Streptomyces milbemycinicus]